VAPAIVVVGGVGESVGVGGGLIAPLEVGVVAAGGAWPVKQLGLPVTVVTSPELARRLGEGVLPPAAIR
jgi:hypothetical protein